MTTSSPRAAAMVRSAGWAMNIFLRLILPRPGRTLGA